MLENLPESFLLQLVNIDPIVGMISKKLRKSCGGSRIDAWKYITSRARYLFEGNKTSFYGNTLRGFRSIMSTKTVSDDVEFIDSGYDNEASLYEAVKWACIYDIPRIIEPCMTAITRNSYIISEHMKAKFIWSYACDDGSTRVLTWFLNNMPDLMKLSIPYICSEHEDTVKWCIDNLSDNAPAPVNWVMMKVVATVEKNTVSMDLLDWVIIPPCPLGHVNCGICPECMIRNKKINPIYLLSRIP